MLTKIELTDFQCHKSLSLELGKITTLVGPSDSGKSAVIRALDWAVFNNGRTALLIRRGAKAASVTITVDDHVITRTTKKNAYIVDGTELSSIGRNQPIDIPNIFRMGEDNIQRQHEYLFWFSASGSELTRNFNRVVDLSKLDEWVHAGIETEKKYKQDVQYGKQRLDELSEQETSLLPYEHLETEIGVIRDSYNSLVSQNETMETLKKICAEDRDAYSQCRVLEKYRIELELFLGRHDEITSEKNLVALCASLHQIESSLKKYQEFADSLRDLLTEYDTVVSIVTSFRCLVVVVKAIRDCGKSLESLRVAASIEIPFRALFSQREELSELASIISVLSTVVPDTLPVYKALEEYRTVSSDLYEISTTANALYQYFEMGVGLQDQYRAVTEEFKDRAEGICPLCGQLMEAHKHE